MTDPTHGQNTGTDAPGTPEPYGARGLSTSAQPRFAAEPPPLADAHSPASPYTVTSPPLPARAIPREDDAWVAPVVQAAPVVPPLVPVVPPIVPVVSPPAAMAAQPDPAPEPEPEPEPDDEFIEPPLGPRPYAVSTLSYSAPTRFGASPSPVPPPSDRDHLENSHPYAPSSPDNAPPVTARPYALPGYGAHNPVPPIGEGVPPEYGSVDQFTPFGGPVAPVMATGFGTARPRTENVGRGLLFALVAVVAGCVLSAVVYHLGYVASIVALAMGGAGIFLYAKGAGTPPRKGAVSLVVLLMAGILLAWVSSIGTELYLYYVDQTGSSAGALAFAVSGALSLELFRATLKDFLIFVAFGALGTFGVARQLLVPRKKK